MLEYITIRDAGGRVSSLECSGRDSLEVIGVLEHCTLFHPDTLEDAKRMREWLDQYIERRELNQC